MMCLLLLSGALHAQATEPALFQALNLVHFSKPIELPDMKLPGLQGQEVRLRAFRGKVLLLNFWTTW